MVKDIEKKFFEAFEPMGILYKCFRWMEHEYDLKFYPIEPKAKWSKETLAFHNREQQIIKEQAEQFDDKVISYDGYHITDSPLMMEIANNLDECKDDKAKEQYIYDLLIPFKKYSDIMHPIAVIERYQSFIEYDKEYLQMLEQQPDSTMKESKIESCKNGIEQWQSQIEKINYIKGRYYEILNNIGDDEETVEYYFARFASLIGRYALALDVLLLKRGINLLYYQQECGIYLFENRDTRFLDDFLGSDKLVDKYLKEALPKHTDEPKQPDNGIVLPDELNTPEAKIYFARAIEYKVMNESYKWLKTKALLAQFCHEMSIKLHLHNAETADKRQYTSWNPFERLFGVKNLRGTYNDFQKTGEYPKGYDIIKKIFDL